MFNSKLFSPDIDTAILNLKALNMSWRDIADEVNATCETNFTPKQLSHRYDTIKDHSEEILDKTENLCYNIDEVQDKLLALKKERAKLSDERTYTNAVAKSLARIETLKDIAVEVAEKIADSKPFLPKTYDVNTDTHNVLTLVISDWHYGYVSDTYWNVYDPSVAVHRIGKLESETIKYINEYEPDYINVVNLGDLISGRIHTTIRLNNRFDVITQVEEVSEILAEFLDRLADYVPVHYYATTDNHSRIEPNSKESLSAETLTRITHWYLKTRFEDSSLGVKIFDNEFDDTMTTFKIFNFNVAGVHGDKDKGNKIVENLTLMTDTKYDLILSAHMHHFSGEEKNKTLVLSNGSLMGTDDYAVNLRCSSHPTQNLILTTHDSVCKALHIINLE